MNLLGLLLQAEPPGSWPGPLSGWELPLTTLGRGVLVALVTIYLAARVRHWFARISARSRADSGTRLVVGRLLSIAVIVVGAATVLDTFGIPLSALVTVVGVIGLAVSLSLQDILKNFFAGLYLLFERPFRIGDVIAVKDQRGIVEHIGVRTTILRTDENVQVLIPNMTVIAEIVSNRTDVKPRPPEPPAQAAATPAVDAPTADSAVSPSRVSSSAVAEQPGSRTPEPGPTSGTAGPPPG